MKKFIELTLMNGVKVHINVDHIGHLYETQESTYNRESYKIDVTVVGTTTHRNGGHYVTETVQEILNLINS